MTKKLFIPASAFLLSLTLSASAATYTYTELVITSGTTPIGPPTAMAINHFGDIVGFAPNVNSGVIFGFVETGGSFVKALAFPGASSTKANGINDAGDIVGEYTDAAGSHGFTYTAGTYTTIDAPSPALPNTTHLTGINNLGQIAGYATAAPPGSTQTSTDSFVYSNGSFTFVPFGPQESITVYGINDSGEIVGSEGGAGTSTAPAYGTANGVTRVDSLGTGIFTAADKTGRVLLFLSNVSYLRSSPTQTETGTPIFYPGSNQTMANGINDEGAVVGSYLDSSGNTHGFVARPPGPPACTATGSSSPRQLSFTITDASGLAQIAVNASTNASVNIPSFPQGLDTVVVTATAIDPGQDASVSLTATNTGGGTSGCLSKILAAPQWSTLGGSLISNITVQANRDGALEAFGLGTDNTLWHLAQNGPAGPWGSWQPLGGASFTSDPVVDLDGAGQLEVLEISSDGTLWDISQTAPGNWSNASWTAITSGVKGRPALVRNSVYALEIFARAADDSVIGFAQNLTGSGGGAWSGPIRLGGVVTSNPAAIGDAASVYALGTDQNLWASGTTLMGFIIPWSFVGGPLKGDPASFPRDELTCDLYHCHSYNGPTYVFARGSDDSLMVNSQSNGSWAGFQTVGGVLISNPLVAQNSDGRIEAFVAGTDNAVWRLAQTAPGSGQWTPFTTLGGVIRGNVTPAIDSASLLNVFVVGSDGGLWYMAQALPGYWR